jgi:hypothetical protein
MGAEAEMATAPIWICATEFPLRKGEINDE